MTETSPPENLSDLQTEARKKLQEAMDRYGFKIEDVGPKFRALLKKRKRRAEKS